VKTVNGIVNARVRVKFTVPVETPQGKWVTSQHVAMFDCAKSTVAAKETIYYADETGDQDRRTKDHCQAWIWSGTRRVDGQGGTRLYVCREIEAVAVMVAGCWQLPAVQRYETSNQQPVAQE
jgi:hypothetical protein